MDSGGFLSEDCPAGFGDESLSTLTESVLKEEDVSFSVYAPTFASITTDLVLEDIPIEPATICAGGD